MVINKFYLNLIYFNLIIFILFSVFIAFFSSEGLPLNVTDFKNYKLFFNLNFKFPYLLDKPLGEDAFYLILAASNFLKKRIMRFWRTFTGIQPLVLIYALIIKILSNLGFQSCLFGGYCFFNSLLIILFCLSI